MQDNACTFDLDFAAVLGAVCTHWAMHHSQVCLVCHYDVRLLNGSVEPSLGQWSMDC